jgi:hypothetical protein
MEVAALSARWVLAACVAVVFLAICAAAYTAPLSPSSQRDIPFAPCYTPGQWLEAYKPTNCTVSANASAEQPEATLNYLIKMRWSRWTRLRAVGTAINPAATNANVNGPRIAVVFDLPKIGCAPGEIGDQTGKTYTFSRVSFGTQTKRLPVRPCLRGP